MVKVSMSREHFEAQLRELGDEFPGGLISADTLKTKVTYIRDHCADDLRGLMSGLTTGTFDNPLGWYSALRHLYENNEIEFTVADDSPEEQSLRSRSEPPRASMVESSRDNRSLDKALETSFTREEFDQLLALAETKLERREIGREVVDVENIELSCCQYSSDFDEYLNEFKRRLVSFRPERYEDSVRRFGEERLLGKLEALHEADRQKLIWCGKRAEVPSSLALFKLLVGALSLMASLITVGTTFFGQGFLAPYVASWPVVGPGFAVWVVIALLISALWVPQGVRAFSERIGDTASAFCWGLFWISVFYAFRWPNLVQGSAWALELSFVGSQEPMAWVLARYYLAVIFCMTGVNLPIRWSFASFFLVAILGVLNATVCSKLFISELAAASVDTSPINSAEDIALISLALLLGWAMQRAYDGSTFRVIWLYEFNRSAREYFQARAAEKSKARLAVAIQDLEAAKDDPRHGKEATGLWAWLWWILINLLLATGIPYLWRYLTVGTVSGSFSLWQNRASVSVLEQHIPEYVACVSIVILVHWIFVRIFSRQHVAWLLASLLAAAVYLLVWWSGASLVAQGAGTSWESVARMLWLAGDMVFLVLISAVIFLGPYVIEMLHLWPEIKLKSLQRRVTAEESGSDTLST